MAYINGVQYAAEIKKWGVDFHEVAVNDKLVGALVRERNAYTRKADWLVQDAFGATLGAFATLREAKYAAIGLLDLRETEALRLAAAGA